MIESAEEVVQPQPSLGGLKHGVAYVQVGYHYPDHRVNAPAAIVAEPFTFEMGKGRWTPGGDGDVIEMGAVRVDVPKGWLYRSVTRGVFNRATQRFDPLPDTNVLVYPEGYPQQNAQGPQTTPT